MKTKLVAAGVTNIDVSIHSDDREGPCRATLRWHKGDRRFHVWGDAHRDGSFVPHNDQIHSNPIESDPQKRFSSQHRVISATAACNAPILAHALEVASSEKLVARAFAENDARLDHEEFQRNEGARAARVRSAAPDLLAALQQIAHNLVRPEDMAECARAALAKVAP